MDFFFPHLQFEESRLDRHWSTWYILSLQAADDIQGESERATETEKVSNVINTQAE